MESTTIKGINHKVLVNFIVVAISTESCPYVIAAPTTDAVSWIANAAQAPKKSCDIFKYVANKGKAINPNAFNKKTNDIDAIIILGLAFNIGAIAAIAVAPQIAVPEAIRIVWFLSTFRNLPSNKPSIKIKITNTDIDGRNVRVSSYASYRGMENANNIIPNWISFDPIDFVINCSDRLKL